MFLPEVCKNTGTTIVAEYLGAGAEASMIGDSRHDLVRGVNATRGWTSCTYATSISRSAVVCERSCRWLVNNGTEIRWIHTV